MHPLIVKYFSTSVIKGKWREIAIGVLITAVLYQNVSNVRWVFWADTIPYLREELAIKDTEIGIIEQSNELLTAEIENMNAEIERWGNISRQLEQNTSILQNEIADIRIKASQNVQIVRREIIPEECTGAMDFLYDSIPELNFNDITGKKE